MASRKQAGAYQGLGADSRDPLSTAGAAWRFAPMRLVGEKDAAPTITRYLIQIKTGVSIETDDNHYGPEAAI